MVNDDFNLNEILEAITDGEIIEKYPNHKRGSCCLINGKTKAGRSVHIVCTLDSPVLIILTVYKPARPKWISPKERGIK